MLENRCTPEYIDRLSDNEIFVFGSKPNGEHVSGAVKAAVEKYGAKEGLCEGFSGQSYAIPVHSQRTGIMAEAVNTFAEFVHSHPQLDFYVLPVGCGKAGMPVETVSQMFLATLLYDNVFLPKSFLQAIKRTTVVPQNEDLPITHVQEVINTDVLRGRTMGLLQYVSGRTATPITFDDEVLKKDNPLLFAFIRVADVMTAEENRVMMALLNELKYISGAGLDDDTENDTYHLIEFVKGWKLDAAEMFDKGGCIYDLLSFTDREWVKDRQRASTMTGYHGKMDDGSLSIFEEDGKYGLKDKGGEVVLSPIYDEVKHKYTGRGYLIKEGNKWGAVNERCEWIFPLEYDDISICYEGGHYIKKNGKWGYVDDNGKEIIPKRYDEVYLCSCNMIRLKLDEKYGYYNMKESKLYPIKYDDADYFSNISPGEAVVKFDGKCGIVDTHDREVLPFIYEEANIDDDGIYRVKKDGLFGIINRKLEVLFPFKYQDLGKFDDDGITYARVKGLGYGYVDKNDNVIVDFKYLYARDFIDGFAVVSGDLTKKGVIDLKGNEVVPVKYDFIHINGELVAELCNGYPKMAFWNKRSRYVKRGVYDLKTRQGLPCIYSYIKCLGRNAKGYMECECWTSDRREPETITVDGSTIVGTRNFGRIAIARDFAVVLEDNGWELGLVGHNDNFKQLCRPTQRKFVKLAAGFDGYMALDNNGFITPGPSAREFQTGAELNRLSCVKGIAASEGHAVALMEDGSVVCIDEPQSYEGPEQYSNAVRDWRNIKQVACGFDFVMGLQEDGSFISVGRYVGGYGIGAPNWTGVKQFDAFNCYYGRCYAIAILNDGRVVSDFSESVSRWRDVVKVAVGNGCAVGLRSDGRAYAIGSDDFVRTVTSWNNIVDINCKFFQAVALLDDGSVVFSMN